MRVQDFKVGDYYRFRAHPKYGYAKCLKILRAKEGENPYRYAIIKCEQTVWKNDTFGFIRYFRPTDLIREIDQEKN